MHPKPGKPGSPVRPIQPREALEAVNATPGETARLRKRQATGSPFKSHRKDPTKKSWIEIKLVDEEKRPVPGEPYEIILPDGGTIASGTLDHLGFARVDGIDSGTCKVTFPELDKDAWQTP